MREDYTRRYQRQVSRTNEPIEKKNRWQCRTKRNATPVESRRLLAHTCTVVLPNTTAVGTSRACQHTGHRPIASRCRTLCALGGETGSYGNGNETAFAGDTHFGPERATTAGTARTTVVKTAAEASGVRRLAAWSSPVRATDGKTDRSGVASRHDGRRTNDGDAAAAHGFYARPHGVTDYRRYRRSPDERAHDRTDIVVVWCRPEGMCETCVREIARIERKNVYYDNEWRQ